MLAGLVPTMFGLDLWLPSADGLPTGVGEALGCSGAPGNEPLRNGWSYLKPALLKNAEDPRVPVASDGFFVIHGEGGGLSREQAQTELRVVVQAASGAEVAGDVSLLPSTPQGGYDFAWVARQPLEVGASLSAVLATEPTTSNSDVGGRFRLDVEGAPTPLPTPELVFDSWHKFYHGTGELVRCRSVTGCTVAVKLVSGNVVEQVSTALRWTPPAITGGVAWNVRVELGAEQWQADSLTHELRFYGEYPEQGYDLSPVVFPHAAGRYCVTLVLEDVRTGQDQRTEACSEPGPLLSAWTDTELPSCSEPPSAELTPTWCELKGLPRPAQCAALLPQGEAPATDETIVRGPDLGDDSSPPSGCQLGPGVSATPAVAALAGLALTWRRRSRGKPRSS